MTELLDEFTNVERERLVRLCAAISGSADAAEDLAQETLIEAWRNAGKLYEPEGRERWLAAIARNVCRRWARRVGLERARVAPEADWDEPADPLDLEEDLDRHELGRLLDRALSALPHDTRSVLAARYIEELPCTEIATRHALSEGAVSMRLSRGRRALRQMLALELRDEASAFGLLDPSSSGWKETRLWCPTCGTCRMLMRREPAPVTLSFRCPACNPPDVTASDYRLTNRHFADLIGTLRQPRRIARCTAAWGHAYFPRALREHRAACTHCGRTVALRTASQAAPLPHTGAELEPVFYVACPACGEVCSTSLSGLVGSHPAFQRFWETQGRIRALPQREIECAGQAALVVGHESISGSASLDFILARASYEVLAVHASSGARVT